MAERIGKVFDDYPDIDDHRATRPWLRGWLGNPRADVWLVAENPSATQVDRIHSRSNTPENQWAASRGDRLLREALVEHGLKTGGLFDPGGWNCYLTNVMKSRVFVKEWNGTKKQEQLLMADMWSQVLRYELEYGHPRVVVVLGENADKALMHLRRKELIPELPRWTRIFHYSYVMDRPDNGRKLGPGHPVRQSEWKLALGEAARV